MQIIPDGAKLIALNQAKRVTGMEKIIGGHKVDVTNYPYQLSLRSYDHHICGASVISMHWALSAAHCVFPQREPRTVSFHHDWAIQSDNRSCFSRRFHCAPELKIDSLVEKFSMCRKLWSTLNTNLLCLTTMWQFCARPQRSLVRMWDLSYWYRKAMNHSKVCEVWSQDGVER